MRNKITFEELKNVITILDSNNINEKENFDYFRITDLNKVKYENDAESTLYFLSYSTKEEEENGWYVEGFDLRLYAKEIASKNPNFTLVIEKEQQKDLDSNTKYIVVDNIRKTVDDLFNYFYSKATAKVITLTGSVGKTTSVGLIENILKISHKVLRIYSKRITPIIMKANAINFLTPDIEYVIFESSIYFHDHVKILTDIIKPNYAAIIDINSSHMGVEKLDTIDDICIYKSEILNHPDVCYLNASDDYIANLNYDGENISYKGKPIIHNDHLTVNKMYYEDVKVEGDTFILGDMKIKPFMLSNLSKIQYLLAYKLGKDLGISNDDIYNGLQNYLPVENRMHTENAFGKEIIFDGDITTYERFKELSDNLYSKKYLVLRKVGSAENTFRIAKIKEFFPKYEKVFIFDDVEYLDKLVGDDNVIICHNHDFMKQLEGTVIYHYSGYFRVWENFDENNLNIYDKEKYPIMLEEE